MGPNWKQWRYPSAGEWVNYCTSNNGVLFSDKKKGVSKLQKDIQEPKMYIAKWKKSVCKNYINIKAYNILEKAKL